METREHENPYRPVPRAYISTEQGEERLPYVYIYIYIMSTKIELTMRKTANNIEDSRKEGEKKQN